jgi:hypothetical protein
MLTPGLFLPCGCVNKINNLANNAFGLGKLTDLSKSMIKSSSFFFLFAISLNALQIMGTALIKMLKKINLFHIPL